MPELKSTPGRLLVSQLELISVRPTKIVPLFIKLSNAGEASLWQFDMPEGMNADTRKQLYLTVVRGNYVVLLNSTATATIPEETARKFLLDTMASLKISTTPIDVKKLSESIRKGVGS